MDSKSKLRFCAILYTFLIILIIILVFYFRTYDTYFRWGVPTKQETPLIILSVKIDNYYKYTLLLCLITVVRIVKVLVSEIADAILEFTIYNPDKKVIKDFTKCELQFYGNYIYFIDSLRYVFTLMITITQIDLAVFGVIIDQITTLFTIRLLLNEKSFNNYEGLDEAIDLNNNTILEIDLDNDKII
jgi:hypothetical protein